MSNAELLYNLYTDTFNLHQENIKNRNKCFIELCVSIAFLFFFTYDLKLTTSIINAIVNKHLNTYVYFQFYIVQSLIWVITLYFTMRYYQLNISIERMYPRLDNLEKQLSKSGNLDFGREGKDYADKYPLVLNLVDIFYKWIFIFVYLIIMITKIFSESYKQPTFIFDLIMFIGCISLTILYFCFLHGKNILDLFKRRK